jgi:GNAT superfamily N-acetyltransferase
VPEGVTVIEGAGQGAAAESILRALPDFFGLEEPLLAYVRAADELPTLVAHADGTAVGFVVLKRTSDAAMELHVMGVRLPWQRRGIGRALVERAAANARATGCSLLHVKTLGPSHPDPGYAARGCSIRRWASCRSRSFRRCGGATTPVC